MEDVTYSSTLKIMDSTYCTIQVVRRFYINASKPRVAVDIVKMPALSYVDWRMTDNRANLRPVVAESAQNAILVQTHKTSPVAAGQPPSPLPKPAFPTLRRVSR